MKNQKLTQQELDVIKTILIYLNIHKFNNINL